MHEFMILPTRASTFMEAMKIGVEVYHNFCLLLRRNMVRMQPTLAMKVVSSLIFRKTKRASSCSSQPLLKLVTQERSHVGNKLAMQEFMILPTILLVLRLLWKL
ncbi:putative phosphopyruvate hydratase [Helianthus annuus]|uniref:phosphopyruvate hydratase n=1 Tax=Helianthus annuus TaxID=4232 RepID=A0A251UP49_HELAN|nr:putative phosphopyruvate hydratase [Helianthus annuus]